MKDITQLCAEVTHYLPLKQSDSKTPLVFYKRWS